MKIVSIRHRAIKYRIYPTREQIHQMICTFGCVRFVYNRCLDEQKRRYAAGEPHLSKYRLNSYCTSVLKQQYPFLRDVDKFALNNAVFALHEGYQRFFQKQGRYPKYKSRRRSRASYTTNVTNNNIAVLEKSIRLPKLGVVKAVIHRTVPDGYVLKSATVSMERDGTFYCSVMYAYEAQTEPVQHPEQNAVGLDYKSNGLYQDSDGHVCGSPRFFRKSEKRLAKLQKALSRKKGSRKGERESNNHKKQKRIVAKAYRHVANQRKDFLHKESTAIASQYDLVCTEGLNMKALSNKGFGNGKATMDNGYGMFLDMLEYKLADRGKHLIKVDRFFPSSQICSCCGTVHPELKNLAIRTWTCPDCGTVHNRDHNAACNIKTEGIRLFLNG